MTISPHILNPVVAFLQYFFSNLTAFECTPRRDGESYTYDVFHNKCKRPHHATYRISNLYIETKYHLSTLQKKSKLFTKGVHVIMTFSNDNVSWSTQLSYNILIKRLELQVVD